MPFTSMVTGTVGGAEPQGPETNVGSGSTDEEQSSPPEDEPASSPDDDAVSSPDDETEAPPDVDRVVTPDDAELPDDDAFESEAEHRAHLEARVARLKADRDRLLVERAELRERYEQLLREEQRQRAEPSAPTNDGFLLRVARRLGLR